MKILENALIVCSAIVSLAKHLRFFNSLDGPQGCLQTGRRGKSIRFFFSSSSSSSSSSFGKENVMMMMCTYTESILSSVVVVG